MMFCSKMNFLQGSGIAVFKFMSLRDDELLKIRWSYVATSSV